METAIVGHSWRSYTLEADTTAGDGGPEEKMMNRSLIGAFSEPRRVLSGLSCPPLPQEQLSGLALALPPAPLEALIVLLQGPWEVPALHSIA